MDLLDIFGVDVIACLQDFFNDILCFILGWVTQLTGMEFDICVD